MLALSYTQEQLIVITKLNDSRTHWTVYILECSDGTFYTGVTNNLANRVEQHNLGKGAKYTRCRLPVKVTYQEHAPDKGSALKREYEIKQLSREKKLQLVSA